MGFGEIAAALLLQSPQKIFSRRGYAHAAGGGSVYRQAQAQGLDAIIQRA
jgi:hypothetical protein